MTTRRASGARGPEALEVGDDVVDLRRREGPLERRHERTGLALLDHQPQLLARAPFPEGGVAEVPRLGLDGGRRRPVAPAPDAVAGRAAGLVDGLPLRDVRAGARLGCRRAAAARGKQHHGRGERRRHAPPRARPSMKICGTVWRPVRRTRSARAARSSPTSISSYGMPRAWRSRFARTQNGQLAVVYIWTRAIARTVDRAPRCRKPR